MEGKPLRRLRLVVEYDGTDFVGWQRQDNGPSVQGALEDAMFAMTGERNEVRGAGRTDSGVHALGQVAHVDTEKEIVARGFQLGLNSALPKSVAVRSLVDAHPDFDARHTALGKLYRYSLWNHAARPALQRRYNWHLRRILDVNKMIEASKHLVGEYDFAAFRAADCDRTNTVRKLHRVDVVQRDELLTVEVEGNAFLKNMVRIITGTLVEVGRGRIAPSDVAKIRDARDRRAAGVTAPALGLCLVRVDYPPDEELRNERRRRIERAGGRLPGE